MFISRPFATLLAGERGDQHSYSDPISLMTKSVPFLLISSSPLKFLTVSCGAAVKIVELPDLVAKTTVCNQLGHSGIKMTADIYGHLVPGANRQAMNSLPSLNSPVVVEKAAGENA